MKKETQKFFFIGAAVLAFLLSAMLFNETASQIIYMIGLLLCAAWLTKKGLETAGGPELITTVGTVFAPVAVKVLSDSPAAQWVSIGTNYCMQWVYNRLGVGKTFSVTPETSIALLFFFLLFLTGFLSKSRTAIEPPKDLTNEFKEKIYAEKSSSFCQALAQRLEVVNNETNWNEALFTPLDAEVEVCIKGKRKKKFSDLLKCLKSVRHKGSVFLVLGDPGAGKSVALRKLCAELLKESARTEIIPVYINLKKWNQNWNMNRLPTKTDLIEFIEDTLREDSDVFTDSFLDTYFHKMLENGRWYFVFDSFDEMPCLMGKQNSQDLIGKISELLCQFMTSKNQNGGIIASRLYKSPTEALKATVTLKIQKFTDIKIKQMLNKYLNNADEVVCELFGKREDLVTLCRNPFYLALLASYIRNNGIRFPANQMELYSTFVVDRLHSCAGKLEAEGFSETEVCQAAKELADFMQNTEGCGLECSFSKLAQEKYGKTKDWRKALRLLDYAKLCRFSEKTETVTFVHRRFQEFFLVESILERKQPVGWQDYQSIVNGSGMRDALVLYCEVADEEQAREIAHFCWNVVKNNIQSADSIWNKGCVDIINALYFMAEAFRNRRSAIEDFRAAFEQLVQEYLTERTDLVVLFALTESMVLFEQMQLQGMVVKVFRLKNRWLNDVVIENCRVINRLSGEIESQFVKYVLRMDIRTFWERFWNMQFSLSVSKNFRYVRIVHFGLALLELVLGLSSVAVLATVVILSVQSLQGIKGIKAITDLFVSYDGWLFVAFVVYNIQRPSILLLLVWIMVSVFCICKNVHVSRPSSLLIKLIQKLKLSGAYAVAYYAIPFLIGVIIICTNTGAAWAQTATDLLCALCTIALFGVIFVIEFHEFREFLKRISWRKFWMSLKNFVAFLLVVNVIAFAIGLIIGLIIDRLDLPGWLDWSTWLPILLILLVSIVGIYLIGALLFHLVNYFFDTLRLKKQPNIIHLSRKELANNILKFKYAGNKFKYVELLRDRNIELTGHWPNNVRPKFNDDKLDYSLAKLDCAKIHFGSRLF